MNTSNNTQFNAIILDLDGPLLDGKQRHYRCYSDIMKKFGKVPLPLNHYWEMKRQRVDRRQLLQHSQAEDHYQDFLREWLIRIEQCSYLALDALQTHVAPVLTAWQQKKISLVLATMRHDAVNLAWQLKQLDIIKYFDAILPIGSLEENRNKATAVGAYIEPLLLKKWLWIGDTEMDIESAQQLQIPVAAVHCGLRTQAYLQSLQPDYIFEDLYDLYNSFKDKL